MKITILTIGSRGDVQPYIGLSQGLIAAGHDVVLTTPQNFQAMIEGYGIPFRPLQGDTMGYLQSKEGREAVKKGDVMKMIRQAAEQSRQTIEQSAKDALEAASGADLLIASSLMSAMGDALAVKLNLPMVGAYAAPVVPTRAYHSITAPAPPLWLPRSLKSVYNYGTGSITIQLAQRLFKPLINEMRERYLDLPPLRRGFSFKALANGNHHIVQGYSEHVFPPAHDLPDFVKVTGFWHVKEREWTPPPELVTFLKVGEKPIYVGFGSMTDDEPEALNTIVLEALKKANQRAIIVSGWGDLGRMKLPESVFVMTGAPHEYLFEHVSAAVHHGGSGTTAASLRAGLPTVVVSFLADQPFMGEQVYRIGAGPRHIPRTKLTPDLLAAAIREAVHNPILRANADRIGQQLRAEDGVGNAVRWIETWHPNAPA